MNIQIQPEILQWVADYCNLSVYEMVNLLKPPYSKHQVLMSGQFTIEQIERLSSVTGVPFGYFFFLIPPVKSKIKKKHIEKF